MNISEFENNFETAYKLSCSDFKYVEKIRKIVLFIVIIIECVILFLFYKFIITPHYQLLTKYSLYFIFIMWFVYFIAQKGIEWFAKINVMSYFLSSFGSLNWNFLGDIIEKDKIKESLIFPSFNPAEFYTRESISGFCNGNKFFISDITLKKGTGIYSFPVFTGLAIDIGLNKKFDGTTIIVEKDFIPITKLEPVKLEDVDWLSKFNVYSDNQIEVRYILNPSLMEQIKEIKETYKAKRIALSFKHNSVLVSLDLGKSFFEICSLLSKIEDKRKWRLLYFKIYQILKLSELFNTKL